MTDRENAKDDAKAVEFYAARVSAWMATKFELDKSLLTLSAAGIGLVITLISTVGVRSVEILILSILTLASFVICLASVLLTFQRNSVYLEKTLSNPDVKDDSILTILDRLSIWSFVGGVLLACIIGFSTAVNSYLDKAKNMTQDRNLTNSTGIESLNGIMNMQPSSQKNSQTSSTPQTSGTATQADQNQKNVEKDQKGQ